MHIVGNMFFLYMFGNNVNDRLGNIGFICFYLAGAVFSGVGHALMGGSSAIGASGAVAAVTGAYLVLFPQSLITIVYWFIFIGTMEISALYFIAFKMIFFDNIISRYTPNVAYDAHLAGYAFGIAAMLIMFAAGLLESVHFDLWSMIRMWNRRRKYRAAVAGGYDPFSFEPDSKQVKDVNKPIIPPQQAEKIKQLRDAITSRISQRNLSAAADTYLELADIDGGLVLPRQQLLDIANQLASGGRSAEAARAYEQFLSHYGKYEHAEQVELMLGILYSRYLHHKEHAVKYLRSAIEKLSDPDQLRMCRDELARLQQE